MTAYLKSLGFRQARAADRRRENQIAEFGDHFRAGRISNEVKNHEHRFRIREVLEHPRYIRLAGVEKCFYAGTLEWLEAVNTRTLTTRDLEILESIERQLAYGHEVYAKAWEERRKVPKPLPEVLRNLPKRPPRKLSQNDEIIDDDDDNKSRSPLVAHGLDPVGDSPGRLAPTVDQRGRS